MSQPKLHWTAYLVPGLPHLWVRGSWAGLALAVGFTTVLDVLVAATLVWHEWLPPQARLTGWTALGVVWALAWLEARANWRRWVEQWQAASGKELANERADRFFRQAQRHYLADDWTAAEKTIRELIHHDGKDVESRLLLVTLLRRSQRLEEAEQALDELVRFEAADDWKHEIDQERAMLQTELAASANVLIEGAANELAEPESETAIEAEAATESFDVGSINPELERQPNFINTDNHARDEQVNTTAESTARKRAA